MTFYYLDPLQRSYREDVEVNSVQFNVDDNEVLRNECETILRLQQQFTHLQYYIRRNDPFTST